LSFEGRRRKPVLVWCDSHGTWQLRWNWDHGWPVGRRKPPQIGSPWPEPPRRWLLQLRLHHEAATMSTIKV
jgi:hypothetical protein